MDTYEETLARLERVREHVVTIGGSLVAQEITRVIETLRAAAALGGVPDTVDEMLRRTTGAVHEPAAADRSEDIPHGEPGHVCGPEMDTATVVLERLTDRPGFRVHVIGVNIDGDAAVAAVMAAARVFQHGDHMLGGMTILRGSVIE